MPPSRALIVEQGRIVVQRAAQERLRFQVVDDLFQPLDLAGHFGGHAFVLGGHFDHRGQVAGRADCVFQRLDEAFQPLELADGFLGLFAIVPEIALAHLLFDGRDLPLLALEVKESPLAGESAFGCCRPGRCVRVPSLGLLERLACTAFHYKLLGRTRIGESKSSLALFCSLPCSLRPFSTV